VLENECGIRCGWDSRGRGPKESLTEGEDVDDSSRRAGGERSMNATPYMSRLNVGRAAVITRVEEVSEPVRKSGSEGDSSGDWVDEAKCRREAE